MSTVTRDQADRLTDRRPGFGFRPSSRSRVRIIAGTLLSLLAIGAILLIFSTANKRVPVLQLVHDVAAGRQVQADDLRTVEISVDPSLTVVPSGELGTVVGQYASARMIAGALLQRQNLQPDPLVQPGAAVVAVVVPQGAMPMGLIERSYVQLVFPTEAGATDATGPAPVPGRVVGLPGTVDPVTGEVSVSVEVSAEAAPIVAAARTVRLVLLAPQGTTP